MAEIVTTKGVGNVPKVSLTRTFTKWLWRDAAPPDQPLVLANQTVFDYVAPGGDGRDDTFFSLESGGPSPNACTSSCFSKRKRSKKKSVQGRRMTFDRIKNLEVSTNNA